MELPFAITIIEALSENHPSPFLFEQAFVLRLVTTTMTDQKDIKPSFSPGEMEESNSSVAPGKVEPHAEPTDGDVAARYANMFSNGDSYSRREWTRLRWKLDMRLVPLLWFNVTLGAMDKVTTATAALYDFREDTKLHGDRYSWVGSAFYVGFSRSDGANWSWLTDPVVWLPVLVSP